MMVREGKVAPSSLKGRSPLPGAPTRCLALLPSELDESPQGYASIATLGGVSARRIR